MPGLIKEAETKAAQFPLGNCPRCSKPVHDFEFDRAAPSDIVITLKPCGCAAHSSERGFCRFMELVKV